MTIVSEENGVVEETAPFVHYRRADDFAPILPAIRPEQSRDITKRFCLPCATVAGIARAAVAWSDVGAPLCSGHNEFYHLAVDDRAELVRLLAQHFDVDRALSNASVDTFKVAS